MMYVKDDLAPNGPPVVFPSQNDHLTKWNIPNKLSLIDEALSRMIVLRNRGTTLFERDAWMVARELYRAGEHFLAVRWLSVLPPEHPIWRTADEGSLATLYLVIWSQEGGKTRADVLPRLTSLWRSLFPGSWDSAPDPA
ncbi:hypothetical protein [Gordonia iterans]